MRVSSKRTGWQLRQAGGYWSLLIAVTAVRLGCDEDNGGDRANDRSRGWFDRGVAGREGFCPVVSDCLHEDKLRLLVDFVALFVIW